MNNFLKTNLFSSILILILLAGNIYMSMQYISVVKELQKIKNSDTASESVKASVVLIEVLDVVLNTRPTTPDDRIKLENDIRQLKDPAITAQWETLVSSKDAKTSQATVLKIVGMLEDKMAK
jgi:hypothetical protein